MTNSIGHFGGSTIFHFKNISVISNGYFAELHFVLWFERYGQLKQPMSVKQCARVSWDYANIFSLSGPPQSNYVIWMEMSLRYLKWVFDGIKFHHLQQKLWIDLWKDINFPQFSNMGILLNHINFYFSPCTTPYINNKLSLLTWLWVNHTKLFSSLAIDTL